MITNPVENWKQNAENGILHGKAGYVLKSSRELINLGMQEEAEAILRSALQRRSWDELSEIKMLTSLCKLIMENDPNEVLQLINESKRKDAGLVLMEATALSNLNKIPDAITLLEKEISLNPSAIHIPDIASKLSILYRQIGNDQKTIDLLSPLVEEGYFKEHLFIKQILADAYIRTRKADKALRLLEGQQDRRSVEMIERARYTLGKGDFVIGSVVDLQQSDEETKEKKDDESIIKANQQEEKSKKIWVIHGRDEVLVQNVFSFLRAIGLDPIEWGEARKLTGVSSPYIGDILKAGFNYAQAFVVLLTGDDEAKLRGDYISKDDPEYERNLTPQARQNVIFEAGMAFGRDPDKIIFVKQGFIRPFSNISGIHVLELNNSPAKRLEFANRLKDAGCDLPDLMTRQDWLKVGDFEANIHMQLRSVSDVQDNSSEKQVPIENLVAEENPKLSKEAQMLLKGVSESYNGRILKPGWGIQIGSKSMQYGDLHPRERAAFDEAIDKLEELGFIKTEGFGREIFTITMLGYQIADNMKKRSDQP